MSAIVEVPGHFIEWLSEARGLKDVGDRFLPRSLYGEYLEETLKTALLACPKVNLCHVVATVLSLRRQGEGFEVGFSAGIGLDSRRQISARRVVLATGNYPPTDPPEVRCSGTGCYVRYPWAQNALEGIRATDQILILGSGLTAVDQVLALHSRGFAGTIHMLSMRGTLPQAHGPSSPWALDARSVRATSTRALVASIRREIGVAVSAGTDWRAVIDAIRPHSHAIWEALPVAEKRRFLRHVRSMWDVHRHRVAPAVHQTVTDLVSKGSLIVIAGRCVVVEEEAGGARVVYRRRGGAAETVLHVDKVINCTGPSTISRLTSDPLIESLSGAGLARPDPVGMGLDVDERGALIDAAGRVKENLFALGPLRKGRLWETTAVPEIRCQAAELAEHLLALFQDHVAAE